MAERKVVYEISSKEGSQQGLKKTQAQVKTTTDTIRNAEKAIKESGKTQVRTHKETESAVSRLNKTMDEQIKRLKEAANQDRLLAKNKQFLKAQIDAENAALAKNNALLRARKGFLGSSGLGDIASRMGLGGMGKLAGPALGLAAVAGVGKAQGWAETGGAWGAGLYGNGQPLGESLYENAAWDAQNIPVFGWMARHSDVNTRTRERMRRMADAREMVGYSNSSTGYALQGLSMRRLAESRMDVHREQILGGAVAERESGNARLAIGDASLEQVLAARGQGAVSRGAIQAEIQAQAGYVSAGEEMRIRQGHQMDVLGRQSVMTDREIRERRKRVAGAEQGVLQGQTSLNNASTEDRRQTERANLERARNTLLAEQLGLQNALNRQLDIQEQHDQTLLQHGKERLDLLQSEYARLQQIIKSEDQRKQGQAQAIGAMNPLQQQQLEHFVKQIEGGRKDFTWAEESAMRQMPGLGDWQATRDAERGMGMAERIRKATGADALSQGAKDRLGQIKQEIKVAMDVNVDALKTRITEQVQPVVTEIVTQINTQMKNELNRLLLQLVQNRSPVNQNNQ